MCNTHKRHATPIAEAIEANNRPMRFAANKTEPIARKSFAAISREWLAMVDKIAKAIAPGKEFGAIPEPTEIHETKAFEPWEIGNIDNEFDAWFSSKLRREIDGYGNEFIEGAAGEKGEENISTNPSPLDLMYYLTIIAAGIEATKLARKEWTRQPASWREKNPWTAGEYVYNPAEPWIREMHRNGYQLVTSATTKQYLPALRRDMVAMAKEGIPHTTIARRIRDQYGEKLYHWQRLVRTEMAIAINKTAIERYEELGGKWVKWSLGSNACEICTGFAATANALETGNPERPIIVLYGVWPIDSAPSVPEVTHPNCRCSWTILFRI
jgi:hypothetical protein